MSKGEMSRINGDDEVIPEGIDAIARTSTPIPTARLSTEA